MLDIVISFVFITSLLLIIFLIWQMVGATYTSAGHQALSPSKLDERSSYSNLNLVTVGILSFLIIPLFLVSTPPAASVDPTEYLYFLIGFVMIGFVSYIYFIRMIKRGTRR